MRTAFQGGDISTGDTSRQSPDGAVHKGDTIASGEELRRYIRRAEEAEEERDFLWQRYEEARGEAEGARRRLESVLSASRDFTGSVRLAWKDHRRLEEEYRRSLARERAERAGVEDSRRSLENLVDGLGAIVWEADSGTRRFTYVGKSCEEILGYPRASWLGREDFFAAMVHPEDREEMLTAYGLDAEDGERKAEFRVFGADGRLRWMQNIVRAGAYEDRLRGLMVDITEIKQAERDRREVDELRSYLATLVQSTNDAVIGLGRDFEVVSWNRGARQMLGYEPGEAEGSPLYEFLSPGEDEKAQEDRRNLEERGEETHDREIRFLTKSGEEVIVSASISPVPDGADNSGYVWVMQDITRRKRAEEALRESEEKYRTLFESMNEGYFLCDVIFDENGKPVDISYLDANTAATRIVDQDFAGGRLREIEPRYEEYWYEIFGNVALTGEAARMERYAAPDDLWYGFHVFKVGGLENSRIAVVFEDVSERKLRERQQEFLLEFSDEIKPLADPATIAESACRMLIEHLNASRAQYTEVEGEPGAEIGSVRGEHVLRGQPMPRRYPLAAFGEPLVAALRAGESLVLTDTERDSRLTDDQRGAFSAVESPSVVSVPLIKEGRFVANFTIHDAAPRDWTADEVALVEEIAERTWTAVERARVEAARRESEERQAFLLKLNDALRAEPDANAVAALAVRLLADELRSDRCYIVACRQGEDLWDVGPEFRVPNLSAMPPVLDQSEFPEALRIITDQTLVFDDTAELPDLTDLERSGLQALRFGALLMAVLRTGERNPAWAMVASFTGPHRWTPSEIKLVEDVAERTWAAIERARVEGALRESEGRLTAIFSEAAAGLSEISLDGRFARVNDGLCEILGRSREELLASHVPDVTHPDDLAETLRAFERVVETGGQASLDKRYVRPDGTVVFANSALTRLDDEAGRPRRVLAVTTDLTARKRAEEERERLRTREAAMRAEKAERERISRELHDQVAHTLGVAHQSLELYTALTENSPERARERFDLARKSTKDALNQTRKLATDLRRSVTEDLEDGLVAALESLFAQTVPESVEARLSHSGDESLVPHEVGTQVYVILREAVRNALAHSRCDRLSARLRILPDELEGTVTDDGDGFELRSQDSSGGIGLRSMRERAESVGGALSMRSNPIDGTTVEVRVPLDGA